MSKYGKVLLCVCLLDLLVTTVGIQLGYMGESNGMLHWVLVRRGIVGLVLIKIAIFTLPGICFIEAVLRFKRADERRVNVFYKIGIWSYVVLFSLGTFWVNFH
jgi:hypothetical protein